MRENKVIKVPELSLIVLIGATGSGKSTFASKHFKPTELVSSDRCRGIVSDDENNQAASSDAFALARYIASLRLKDWVKLAREYHVLPVAIVMNLPEKVCAERNVLRPDRNFGKHVIPQHIAQLKRSIKKLKFEGFRHIFELRSIEEVNALTAVVRDPLYNDKKDDKGPFDIVGDVHGCYDELVELLAQLGYEHDGRSYKHAEGRKAVFVGDLVIPTTSL